MNIIFVHGIPMRMRGEVWAMKKKYWGINDPGLWCLWEVYIWGSQANPFKKDHIGTWCCEVTLITHGFIYEVYEPHRQIRTRWSIEKSRYWPSRSSNVKLIQQSYSEMLWVITDPWVVNEWHIEARLNDINKSVLVEFHLWDHRYYTTIYAASMKNYGLWFKH